jgi:hypothetical protein
MRHPLHPIRSLIVASAQIHFTRHNGDYLMGTTHPPRDPTQVPDPLKDDVGKHQESEFNEDSFSDDDDLDDDEDDQLRDDDD